MIHAEIRTAGPTFSVNGSTLHYLLFHSTADRLLAPPLFLQPLVAPPLPCPLPQPLACPVPCHGRPQLPLPLTHPRVLWGSLTRWS